MFDGNRFLPDTGMPILNSARKRVLLAVELPEPFLVPTMIEKSFTTLFIMLLNVFMSLRGGSKTRRGNLHLSGECLSTRVARFFGDCFSKTRNDISWSLVQQVGMGDQRLIASLGI